MECVSNTALLATPARKPSSDRFHAPTWYSSVPELPRRNPELHVNHGDHLQAAQLKTPDTRFWEACQKKADPNRFAFVMMLDGPNLPMWQQYVESTIVRVRA